MASTADERDPALTGAQYVRIADHYRDQIAAGELRPGDRLPSARDIAQRWGVARPTADRAISELRDRGLVSTRDRSRAVIRETTGSLSVAVGLPAGADSSVESAEIISVDTDLSRKLGLAPGSSLLVVRISRSEQP